LYRFFLADARTAAREGNAKLAMECLEMALDFAPDSQRERVLLVAAEIAPASETVTRGLRLAAGQAVAPFTIAIGEVGSARRISWEDRAAVVEPAQADTDRPLVAPTVRTPRWHRRRSVFFALAALASVAALAVRARVLPPGAVEALGLNQVEAARRAAAAGQPGEALRLLDGMGADAPSSAWLVRARALELRNDTAGAVRALVAAASADVGGGSDAMFAGDELVRLRAIEAAADAYLYAVTPQRTSEEIERIARTQVRAGHADRARRVRSEG